MVCGGIFKCKLSFIPKLDFVKTNCPTALNISRPNKRSVPMYLSCPVFQSTIKSIDSITLSIKLYNTAKVVSFVCSCLHVCTQTHRLTLTHSISLTVGQRLNSTFTAHNMHDTLNSSYSIHECSSVMLLCHLFSFPAPSYNAVL